VAPVLWLVGRKSSQRIMSDCDGAQEHGPKRRRESEESKDDLLDGAVSGSADPRRCRPGVVRLESKFQRFCSCSSEGRSKHNVTLQPPSSLLLLSLQRLSALCNAKSHLDSPFVAKPSQLKMPVSTAAIDISSLQNAKVWERLNANKDGDFKWVLCECDGKKVTITATGDAPLAKVISDLMDDSKLQFVLMTVVAEDKASTRTKVR
jgi:hypothetical protein